MNSFQISITDAKYDYDYDYKLSLLFSDGKAIQVDFYPFLNASRNPEIKKYLNFALFKSFKIVDGDLLWGDFDLLFPIWDLYKNSIMPSYSHSEAS